MKVLIADDQAEVRSAIRVLLEQENEIYVIDEAEELNSMFMKVESGKPDLLLLDWELSNRILSETISVLRQLAPGIRIIALSVRPEAAMAAMKAGVNAFVSKGENSDRLLSIIYEAST